MKTIEALERELEIAKAKLQRDIALARQLPTTGKTFEWLGDGGYKGNDKLPDVTKTVELDPWLFHSPFRGAQHVAYKAPDEYGYDGKAARMRRDFVRAVHDAYAPYLVDILALKGTYASNVRSNWDWQNHADYRDAKIVGTGRVDVRIFATTKGGGTASVEFFAALPDVGTVQVSMDLPEAYKLQPRPHGVKRCCDEIHSVDTWQTPAGIHPSHTWSYGSGYPNLSRTVSYLYPSLQDLLTDIWSDTNA